MLVVAATAAETAPLVAGLTFRADGNSRVTTYGRGPHTIDVLTTGVGMVATAARCARTLAVNDYDIALNVGLCGSFDPALAVTSVVQVVTEQLPELGAEDGDAFLSIRDLRLLGDDEFPFQAGRLVNPAPPRNEALARLPAVHGITVNTVHGDDRSIAAVRERCGPQVESMEGAAFMYACLVHQIPFAEVRAVSNVVEKRNRGSWKMAEAIDSLGDAVLRIIDGA